MCRPSALALLFIVACAGGPTIRTASNPAASFTRYHTFSIGTPEGPPAGYQASAWSPELQRRLGPLVTAALQQRGYAPVTQGGDLVITFGSGRRDVAIHETSGVSADWLPADENAEFVEGSLVIDAFDGSTKARVWRGSSRAHIRLDGIDGPLLQRSVETLVAAFPSRGRDGI